MIYIADLKKNTVTKNNNKYLKKSTLKPWKKVFTKEIVAWSYLQKYSEKGMEELIKNAIVFLVRNKMCKMKILKLNKLEKSKEKAND